MKKNMGTTDRLLRLLIAAAIAVMAFANIISGVPATVLLVIAGVFLLTSLIGYCPLYTLLGISTNRIKAGS